MTLFRTLREHARFVLGLGLLALAAPACATNSHDEIAGQETVALEEEPIALESTMWRVVPEELMPAFEVVVQALEDGDERVARGALDRIRSWAPEGRTLELVEAFERILDGRAVRATLEFSLTARELEEGEGVQRLSLRASQRGEDTLILRSSGARLRRLLVLVDPDGRERRSALRRSVPFPKELVLEPGEVLELELADLDFSAPQGLLALSALLELELLPGEFLVADGRSLPAQDIPIEELEIVRLASELPTASIAPEEVADYVARGRIYVPALMERVVRVLPEEREAALDALSPLVADMGLLELELLVPGLRWLSRSTAPGGNPEAWRVWMERRAQRRSAQGRGPSLSLPRE